MKRKPAKDFQDLIVWQKAHQFVLSSYHLSDSFPLLLFWILAPDSSSIYELDGISRQP